MISSIHIVTSISSSLMLFCLNFFRDPKRIIPKQDNLILSPADGKIIKIDEIDDPIVAKNSRLVSIFLSVFNVHANRMPVRWEVY